MKRERWRRVEQIYNAALERNPDQRQAFLNETCAGDDSLRREIESLLACQSEADGFIESPALEAAARVLARDHARDASAALAGRTLLHYRVEGKIGQGGMGVVYKAWDSHLNRFVAVKVLPLDKMADLGRRQRFIQEAKAASALNHPNIITIHDIARQDDLDFMIMEYVAGKTLDESIGRKGLRLNPALKCAIQIADALARAHQAGIVHRDLKPSNVMVDEHGLVKVLDFGLAKLTEKAPAGDDRPTQSIKPHSDEGMIVGTVAYMSPEQAEGRAVDARSDIFSFGSLLYEMTSGRRAFQGESHLSTLAALLRQEPKPLEGLPPELERVIGRCLRKDPARRFQHMDDVKVALEELKEESDSGKLLGEQPVAPKRRRWLLPVTLAAVVTLLAGSVWVWRVLRPQPAATGPSAQGPVLTRLTSDSGLTTEPALSPDGKLLVYASDRSGDGNLDLWLQQIPGGQPIRLTKEKADAHEPSFSPDGMKIAYRSERDGGIYVIPALGGGDARKIADKGRNPKFSPDGIRIAYWTGLAGGALLGTSAYVVPAAGGTPELLRPDFIGSMRPSWSPDGKAIGLIGQPKGGAYDYWVVPESGGAAVQSGFASAVSKSKLRTSPYSAGQWLGDRLLFSAQLGDSTNLWETPMSPQTWKVTGEPRRLTFGIGEDLNPCLGGGRLVFASVNTNLDLWSLPLDAAQGKVLGGLERITKGAADDNAPSISADGKKVIFRSNRSGKFEIWIKDLETRKETVLTSAPAISVLSPDGTKVIGVLPITQPGPRFYYVLELGKNIEKKVGPASPVGPWSISTGRNRFMVTSGPPPRNLTAIDMTSGAQTVCLQHPKYDLYQGIFSPDDRWILFVAIEGQGPQSRLFIAPYREGPPPGEKEWIAVTDGTVLDDIPRWSPDGGIIYFLSDRDGFRCLWAQRVDNQTKKPVGGPISIYHFHRAGLLTQRHGNDPFQIGVARDKIVFNLREATGNIWMTTIP